ncbi:uncharacterized protein [Dermacentor albipictus]|uniref:uncharacterized protein isoform X4 n=1 Tax=Dermacentor albipictus TaxID=60249 RepID=UPI0031FBC0EC
MESKGQWLRKQRFLKCHNEEALGPISIILPLVYLFVVVLVVLCVMFQYISMLSKKSPDEAVITVDTLAPFYVETKSMPDVKRPPEDHELWSAPALVNRSLTPARIAPTLPTSRSGVCTTFDCRYAAQWLRSKLDYSVDPCKDFYKFVCGSFRGFDEFIHLARGIEVTTKAFLGNLRVPSSNQNSQQKAAGMYQACVAFAWSGREETTYLVKWMISLNLDLMNQTRLAAVNPVEMMVRASLDLGVKAVIAIVLRKQDFLARKRVIQIEYSKEQKEWMIQRSSEDDNIDYYARHLQRYGVNPPEDTQLALKIIGYERQHVPLEAVDQAKRMFTNIRGALRKSFESSSWFKGRDLEVALRKVDRLTGHVGSGNRLDPQFVEKHYKQYPDALPDRLFPVWIKARSLSSHDMWADQTSWFYDEAVLGAFYNNLHNTLVVPRALLLRPFFRPFGPLGLNYAGLGAIMGHEIMHAFDVQGIMHNDVYEPWASNDIIKEYTKKAVCLRQSHRSVLSFSARQEVLNDTADSENMADLVGAMTAYATYASLPPAQANVTLAGLDMSAERLFFINYCVMWCHEYGASHVRYAPDRSRCIVPLMNMPEFASAFGCAVGEPMNPRKKCNFWQ